jgi:hypothetical protein
MPYGLTLQTPPIVEPVTLDQAKNFCVVSNSFTDDDELISGLVTAGRQAAEVYTRRAFFNQTWLLTLDHFPIFWGRSTFKNIGDSLYPYQYFFDGMTIRLPKPKCVSITSFNYLDVNGDAQSLSSDEYILDTNSEPARMIPVSNSYWPTASVYVPGSVQITYQCGTYGDGVEVNTCPRNVCTAISVFTSHYYVNREGSVPLPDAFYRLLDPVKFTSFGFQAY